MEETLLKRKAVKTDKLRYVLYYRNEFVDPKEQEIDASHIHSCVEVYVNLSGDVSFLVQNEMLSILRGDVVFTRANEYHHCIYPKACMHEHFCFWLDESFVKEFLGGLFKSGVHHLRLPVKERGELLKLFFELKDAISDEKRVRESARIFQIFDMLETHVQHAEAVKTDVLPAQMQKILDEIGERFAEIAGTADLAERFFISPSTLNRWFLKYLHVSPKEYLEGVRLSAAKRMLDEGKSVTSACFDCGYCDSSHFIRAFKDKFSITPGRYQAKK
jgi:AraC-like DNA-binding protein